MTGVEIRVIVTLEPGLEENGPVPPKSTQMWLARAATAALLWSACGGDGGPALPPEMTCGDADDEELGPNNDLATAPALAAGKIIGGCVDAPGDRDHYLFETPADAPGGYLSIAVTNLGTERVAAAVFLYEGEAQAANFLGAAGENIQAHVAMVPETTYAVRIMSAVLGTLAEPFPYHLALKWNRLTDAHEPNDASGMAKTIRVGKPTRGRLFAGFRAGAPPVPADYDDWYKVNLAAGQVAVSVSEVPANLAVRLELRDADEKEYLCAAGCLGQAGQTLESGAQDIEAGEYLLRLSRHAVPEPKAAATGEEAPIHFTQDYVLTITQ